MKAAFLSLSCCCFMLFLFGCPEEVSKHNNGGNGSDTSTITDDPSKKDDSDNSVPTSTTAKTDGGVTDNNDAFLSTDDGSPEPPNRDGGDTSDDGDKNEDDSEVVVGTLPVGSPCTEDNECITLQCVKSAESNGLFKNGYCTSLNCAVEDPSTTAKEDDCPAGSFCAFDLLGKVGENFCVAMCDSNKSCGSESLACDTTLLLTGMCLPSCGGDDVYCTSVYGNGSKCNINTNRCEFEGDPNNILGGPCTEHNSCPPGGYCLPETLNIPVPNSTATMPVFLGFVGGYCTQSCVINDDCGVGNICVESGLPEFGKFCMVGCDANNEGQSACIAGRSDFDYVCGKLPVSLFGLLSLPQDPICVGNCSQFPVGKSCPMTSLQTAGVCNAKNYCE